MHVVLLSCLRRMFRCHVVALRFLFVHVVVSSSGQQHKKSYRVTSHRPCTSFQLVHTTSKSITGDAGRIDVSSCMVPPCAAVTHFTRWLAAPSYRKCQQRCLIPSPSYTQSVMHRVT